jgi:hypothetical protein
MKTVLTRSAACAALLMTAATCAQAQLVSESIAFTTSDLVSVPGTKVAPVYTGLGACDKHAHHASKLGGDCAVKATYTTATAGSLTVSATDGPDYDALAYMYQSTTRTSAGLGAATGYVKTKTGEFVVVDDTMALARKEQLTLSFAEPVKLESAVMFPNDRSSHAITHELDYFDGFSVSVDGGPFVEYSFDERNKVNFCKPVEKAYHAFIHPLTPPSPICAPLTGSKFVFGYAQKLSPERYYIGGVTFKRVAPPPVIQ